MSERLTVVGDSLLDRDVDGWVERLSPDAPVPVLDEADARARPGGAALAATLAARDGHDVTLVTALARDSAGLELATLLDGHGIELVDLGLSGATPEKIRFRSDGRPLMRLDRGGRDAAPLECTPTAAAAIGDAHAILVADYGRGMTALTGVREALGERAADAPVVWDPHPRGAAPVAGTLVATPNEGEVRTLAQGAQGAAGRRLADTADLAAALRARWGTEAVCATRGELGALLVRAAGAPMAAPAPRVQAGDACGAGDRFASSLTLALAGGDSLENAVVAAVMRASSFVAAGGAESVCRRRAEGGHTSGLEGAERVRAQGGTVVATGGCFDLLHAGHVRTLEAARRLGDCLVVCINSDESVRRLKGPSRPLVPERDRASVVGALESVDAVTIFREDAPDAALRVIRPHIWVKGGDYDGRELPEERALADWGGRVVLLPYVEGRSTTRLIEEAATRG